MYQAELACEPVDTTSNLEAREALGVIESTATSAQWMLISAIGQGYTYADIGLEVAVSAAAARTQISRLRQQFSDLRPAA
jgi:hypothetical protein